MEHDPGITKNHSKGVVCLTRNERRVDLAQLLRNPRVTQKRLRHFDESRCGASFNGKPKTTEEKGVRSRLRLAVKRGSFFLSRP
jgi:hypothetical protein